MLVPSLRNKLLVIAVKNYTESDFKVSWSCPVLLDYLVQIIFPGSQMFITPGKNLQLWVPALKQGSYLLYVRKEIIFRNI